MGSDSFDGDANGYDNGIGLKFIDIFKLFGTQAKLFFATFEKVIGVIVQVFIYPPAS